MHNCLHSNSLFSGAAHKLSEILPAWASGRRKNDKRITEREPIKRGRRREAYSRGENRGKKSLGKIISGTNMALLVAVVETSAEEITPHLAHLSVILYSGTVI